MNKKVIVRKSLVFPILALVITSLALYLIAVILIYDFSLRNVILLTILSCISLYTVVYSVKSWLKEKFEYEGQVLAYSDTRIDVYSIEKIIIRTTTIGPSKNSLEKVNWREKLYIYIL